MRPNATSTLHVHIKTPHPAGHSHICSYLFITYKTNLQRLHHDCRPSQATAFAVPTLQPRTSFSTILAPHHRVSPPSPPRCLYPQTPTTAHNPDPIPAAHPTNTRRLPNADSSTLPPPFRAPCPSLCGASRALSRPAGAAGHREHGLPRHGRRGRDLHAGREGRGRAALQSGHRRARARTGRHAAALAAGGGDRARAAAEGAACACAAAAEKPPAGYGQPGRAEGPRAGAEWCGGGRGGAAVARGGRCGVEAICVARCLGMVLIWCFGQSRRCSCSLDVFQWL